MRGLFLLLVALSSVTFSGCFGWFDGEELSKEQKNLQAEKIAISDEEYNLEHKEELLKGKKEYWAN